MTFTDMTLAEFLLARIAEDEAPAREALEMDARVSPPQEVYRAVPVGTADPRNQRAACAATPWLRVRTWRALARARPGRLHSETRDRDPTLHLRFGRRLLR